MTNQYDIIKEKYRLTKNQPWRHYIEEYTLFTLLGNIKDKSILDLACGDGYYTEKMFQKHPTKIIVVDISQEMINLALSTLLCMTAVPNKKYITKDATILDLNEKFDIITGIYLLNYAKTENELDQFVKSIKRHLKDDGVFIGVNSSMDNTTTDFKKYGFEKIINNNIITWKYYTDSCDLICEFNNYYIPTEIYEKTFLENNLEIKWIQPHLDPSQDVSHWYNFIRNNPIVFMEVNNLK